MNLSFGERPVWTPVSTTSGPPSAKRGVAARERVRVELRRRRMPVDPPAHVDAVLRERAAFREPSRSSEVVGRHRETRTYRIRSKALDGSRNGLEPGFGARQRDERASARAQRYAVEASRDEGVGAVRARGQRALESAAGVLRADPRNQRKPAIPGTVHDVEALSPERIGDRAASESTARGRGRRPPARGRPPRWQRRRPSRSRRGSRVEPPRRARRPRPPCTSRARSSSSSGSGPRRRRPPESAPPTARRATRWSRSRFPGRASRCHR